MDRSHSTTAGLAGVRPWFVFAGGGSGGHLYPALSVVAALRERVPAADVTFFGSARDIDQRVLHHSDCELIAQPVKPVRKSPTALLSSFSALIAAYREAKRRFRGRQPAAVVGSGGMAALPAMLAASHLKIPSAVLNPDAVPGRANRFLSRRADRVFVQWEAARGAFAPSVAVEVVGCPVRPAFATASREAGMAAFGLSPDKKTLLITGASLGARSINEAMVALWPEMSSRDDWQMLHLTGRTDFDTVRDGYARHVGEASRDEQPPADAAAANGESGGRSYRVPGMGIHMFDYTDAMPEALAAADLAITRAGASTLAELTAAGCPALLMPYPYHKDQHQWKNARCLIGEGAAEAIEDAKDASQNACRLRETLFRLMKDDDSRVKMAKAARRLARPDAARTIADRLLAMAGIRAAASLA